MNSISNTLWPESPIVPSEDVPSRYWGVWSRTLLRTPEISDSTTFVRWMQLSRWHADLRVPISPQQGFQGFSGLTQVSERKEGEVCTWHRWVDIQAPRDTPDEGLMVFETPERVIETGIHGIYHEVWERLPGSLGQRLVLAQPIQSDGTGGARLFVSGQYLMRVRPCKSLDSPFEISFGTWDGQVWRVEQSTITALLGQAVPLTLSPMNKQSALVTINGERPSEWSVLEWARPETVQD